MIVKKIKNIMRSFRQKNDTLLKLQQQIDELNAKIVQAEKHNYIVERDLMKALNVFEYKYYQHNNALNQILYFNELEKKKSTKDFNPLVSIIIPVYNGSNFLAKAIDSALAQTYKNIEVIVVNDGSTDSDETEKVALKYKNKIKYYKKENGGVSSALNYGIKRMSGDYFAWLSHDDLFYPNHIYENINYLKYHLDEKIITYSNFDIIDENDKVDIQSTVIANIHGSDYKMSKITHWACILQGDVNGGSVVIPRVAFEKFEGFDEKDRISQEKDMWSRLLSDYQFINIPFTTTALRVHSKRVTSTTDNVSQMTTKKVMEILSKISENDMIKESGSIKHFYIDLMKHCNNNALLEEEQKIKELYDKLKND